MKLIVKYVDFHWDNHQGGSGKSFEFCLTADVPEGLLAVDIFDFIHRKVEEKVQRERLFAQQTGKYSIQSVEIV
jgi:hypothetical protein